MTSLVRRVILVAVVVAIALMFAIAALRVARDVPTVDAEHAGMVAPFASAIGISARTATLATWLVACVSAIAAALALRGDSLLRRAAAEAPDALDARRFTWLWRPRPWLAVTTLIVLLGLALRAHAAAWLPWDIDEPWAFPTRASIFDDSHDALVHPPLFRALALGWDALVGWTLRAPRWLLRAPSLVASSAALALVASLALTRPSPRALVALVCAALATAPIAESALARPYGVACLSVVLLAVIVLDSTARRLTSLEAALCVLAFALAAWTDLVAGLAAFITLALRCAVDLRARRLRDAVVLSTCASLLALPLVPGALRGWRTGIDPETSALQGVLPDLLPDAQLSYAFRAHELFAALSDPLPAASALVCLCALLAIAWHRGARVPAALLSALSALPLALLPFIALRPRHFAWLPLVALVVLVVLPPSLPRRAR